MLFQSTLSPKEFRKCRLFEYWIVAALLIALAIAIFGTVAHAETTLGASATVANGELRTTLTWDSTLSSCVGSGHPAWDGPKASSGTQELPVIALSGTYPISITCSDPEDRTATLTWRNPTKNTDGTAYTNPAGTRIHYGRSPDVLDASIDVNDPNLTTFVIDDLDVGEWFFAVTAFNDIGAESALSNLKSKTMRAGTTETETVRLTVNPVPASGVLEDVE